jgi:penicillin-binding protein 2
MSRKEENARLHVFSRRALLLGGAQAGLFGALAGRMYYLQVVTGEQYRMLAEENRINLRLLPPLRGTIVDRFGVELATNRQNYRVIMIPEQTRSVAETLDALARLIALSEPQRARILRQIERNRGFIPVTVAENLTWEEFAAINVRTPDLPGVQPDVGDTRHYPHAETCAHLIGYVGAVAEGEAGQDPLLQLPGFRIGKTGIEKTLDLPLRGKAGNSRVEVNAYGREIRELMREEGVPGEEAVLTIDLALQTFVVERLKGESAAVVVMEIHSGEVLALVSCPSYNPNAFSLGLSHKDWRALLDDPGKPLINKAAAGQYPPGSTFKPAVAVAALEAGAITPDATIFCNGHIRLGNHIFHCWKRGGHGHMDLRMAIAQSCDVYFYEIARRTGIDRLVKTIRLFGFDQRLCPELPGEKGGLIPDPNWKRATFGAPWQQGETLITGIGQGFVLTTPLQLAVMTARIANSGRVVLPRLIRYVGQKPAPAEPAPALPVDPKTLALVRAGMDAVVNHPRGTAHKYRLDPAEGSMAGKTGTAQVRRISRGERASGVRRNEDLPWEERDHALFVAYGPVEAPRYALALIVEHGGSGSGTAAPIARDILREALRRDPARMVGYRPGAVAEAAANRQEG